MAGAAPDPIDDLQQRCKELGIPLTIQRRAIYEVIASRRDHPTAEQIFEDLGARLPGISKATAYRTLEKLVVLSLVVRVSHPGSAARYDAKTRRHHHLLCEVCGALADLESKALDGLRLPDLSSHGFEIRDFSVHVLGRCRACAQVPATSGASPRRGRSATKRARSAGSVDHLQRRTRE